MELVKQFPCIKVTVQDLSEVIDTAPEVVDCVEFQACDFFTEQPVKGADVYLFRMIFHNWSDKYCVKLLRNLVPAPSKDSKVMINDRLVPKPDELSPYKDRLVRAFDVVMEERLNSKERNIEDWTTLLKQADERFHVKEVKRSEGSTLQIIDVEWP